MDDRENLCEKDIEIARARADAEDYIRNPVHYERFVQFSTQELLNYYDQGVVAELDIDIVDSYLCEIDMIDDGTRIDFIASRILQDCASMAADEAESLIHYNRAWRDKRHLLWDTGTVPDGVANLAAKRLRHGRDFYVLSPVDILDSYLGAEIVNEPSAKNRWLERTGTNADA